MQASSRRISAPTPLRPADLVRGQRQQIGAERLDVAGNAARRLHRIDMQQAARRMHDRGHLATGWITPVSLLASITETSGRTRACEPAARSAVEIDHAAVGDRNLLDAGGEPAAARAPKDARSPTPAAGRGVSGRQSMRASAPDALASVPPEVKRTCSASAPTSAATCSRARLDQPPRRPPLGMDRRRIAGQVQRRSHCGARLRPQRRGRIPVEIGPRRSSDSWRCRLSRIGTRTRR